MSLRLRLLLVVGLSLVALVAAGLAMTAVVRDSDASREGAASSGTEAAALAIARVFGEHARTAEASRDPDARAALLAAVTRVLASATETVGGYCYTSDGLVLEVAGGARAFPSSFPPPSGPHPPPFPPPPFPPPPFPPGHGPHGPPPDVRAALDGTCRAAVVGRFEHRRLERRRDVLVVTVTGVTDGVAAFAIRNVPRHASSAPFGWSAQLLAMAALTLLIVVVMVDAMLAVKRGASELSTSLARLEADLHADVPMPRAKELADVAVRLRAMARHLAEARERERELSRKVAHEARLAALGRLVAGVAHEIRNPLTGIKLLLDGIARRPVDTRTAADVETAKGEIGRLDHVVSSLLGVARDARTEPVAIALGELADERIVLARELGAARDVRVVREGDADVVAERDVVVRVLDNLLRNAVEASPDGGVVTVRVAREDDAVVLAVVDQGAGVPKAREAELFEPFFTLKPDGTGLGLWLSRALAEARGFGLDYAREKDQTRFSLRIPGAPRAEDQAAAPRRR